MVSSLKPSPQKPKPPKPRPFSFGTKQRVTFGFALFAYKHNIQTYEKDWKRINVLAASCCAHTHKPIVVLRSLTKFLELVGYTPQMQIQPVPSPQAVLATRVALLNVCMLQGVARTQEVPHFNESSLANVYGFLQHIGCCCRNCPSSQGHATVLFMHHRHRWISRVATWQGVSTLVKAEVGFQ